MRAGRVVVVLIVAFACSSLHGRRPPPIAGVYQHELENEQVALVLQFDAEGRGTFRWPADLTQRPVAWWIADDGDVRVRCNFDDRRWCGHYQRVGGDLSLLAVQRDIGSSFEPVTPPQRYVFVPE